MSRLIQNKWTHSHFFHAHSLSFHQCKFPEILIANNFFSRLLSGVFSLFWFYFLIMPKVAKFFTGCLFFTLKNRTLIKGILFVPRKCHLLINFQRNRVSEKKCFFPFAVFLSAWVIDWGVHFARNKKIQNCKP